MRSIDPTLRRRTTAGLVLVAIGAILAAAPATALMEDLTPGEQGRVAQVIDGDTVVLDTGLAVRLVGLQAPKLALGRRDFVEWPLAEQARAVLAGLVANRDVGLRYGGARRDRHGRALAHLFRDDGLWVQRAMLEAGMARVYSFADNRVAIDELLGAERAARAVGRGLWGHPHYRVRTAAALEDAIDSFHLVEGVVESASVVRGRIYVNFGADWRTDFTITVAPRDRRKFEAAWADAGFASVAALAGLRVRVRGWIGRYNGPQIVADHPEQIELLDMSQATGPTERKP